MEIVRPGGVGTSTRGTVHIAIFRASSRVQLCLLHQSMYVKSISIEEWEIHEKKDKGSEQSEKKKEQKKNTKKNIFIETKSNITDACYNNNNVIIRSLLREKTKK